MPFKKGQVGWWKDHKFSEEHIKNMSKSHKGHLRNRRVGMKYIRIGKTNTALDKSFEIVCAYCGKKIFKINSRRNRNSKLHFCNRDCYTGYKIKYKVAPYRPFYVVSDKTRERLSEAGKRGHNKESNNPNWIDGRSKDKNFAVKATKEWRRKNPLKFKRQIILRRMRKKKGGELFLVDIQRVYKENIECFGVLSCYLCFKPLCANDARLEHIIPLSKGGTNRYENLAIACGSCNSIKKDRSIDKLCEVENQ